MTEFSLPAGVEFFVDFAEVLVGDVGVDLRRADIGVAKEGLDGAQVGSVTEKVCCKAMPKSVRRNPL